VQGFEPEIASGGRAGQAFHQGQGKGTSRLKGEVFLHSRWSAQALAAIQARAACSRSFGDETVNSTPARRAGPTPGRRSDRSGLASWMAVRSAEMAEQFLHPLRARRGCSERPEAFSSAHPRCWRWKLTAKRWARAQAGASNCSPTARVAPNARTRPRAETPLRAAWPGSRPPAPRASRPHAGPPFTARAGPCPHRSSPRRRQSRDHRCGAGCSPAPPARPGFAPLRPITWRTQRRKTATHDLSAIAMKSSVEKRRK